MSKEACNDAAALVLAPLVLSEDVPNSAAHLALLCSTRKFQALQDELANVMALVPLPLALGHFAYCIDFHIQTASFNWAAYLNSLVVALDVASKRTSNDPPPSDVRHVSTSIYLHHLANLPEHVHATVTWCKLYHVDIADRITGAMSLLYVNSKAALDLMHDLSLLPHLPADSVMRLLLETNDIPGADRFVLGDPIRQRALVHLMIEHHVDDKVIKKRLTKFRLPPDDFPVYVERRRRATLRYLAHAKQYSDVPDAAGSSDATQLYAANLLYDQCGHDNPITRYIVHLFGLGAHFPDVLAPPASFDLGANKDDPPPLAGFLTLEHLHATVEFVDSVAAATAAAAFLLSEPVVGLDTEWRSSFDAAAASTTPCAVLQFASASRAFVIDLQSPRDDAGKDAILAAFLPLFTSDAVLKLGLDVSGDFKALGVRPVHCILDLQTLQKAIGGREAPTTGAKTSLTDLCRHYLGFPLDKRTRMSNWTRRPLTSAQMEYAALDAVALVHIYHAMKAASEGNPTKHKAAKTSNKASPKNSLFGSSWIYSI
ncbi:hypothetical protein H257_05772 [Aphanomyces astaci]|uniref:3'-5' exonuclease domain-containing protein n=1 Tax=Aphanomyces astaci TaxID=112090 RepID=W4GNC7_APHAT|nr:hypothetical protein H257_05772 [Aphanomyces astaci]ETV81187.1 hypothetical protein H257_05772 [Aphanomyces astaci]|eukprot:XP_009829045.1 hypothetical protein H257_05772 [Aphanomyces astaci]